MSISKTKAWINHIDPYGLMRVVLYKSLVIATLLTLGYWLLRPNNYLGYLTPIFVISLYEMPVLSNFKIKEFALIFIFTSMLICSLSFYLLLPFHLFFLLYAILFFCLSYALVLQYLPMLKNTTMVVLSASCALLLTTPPGNLQIAYDILSSMSLSMFIFFFSLRRLKPLYFYNWSLAQTKYLDWLAQQMNPHLNHEAPTHFIEEVNHINMLLAYQGLLNPKYRFSAYKMSYHTRKIKFAIVTLSAEEKNIEYWQKFKTYLEALSHHLHHRTPYPWEKPSHATLNAIQLYAQQSLEKTVLSWNQLCDKLSN